MSNCRLEARGPGEAFLTAQLRSWLFVQGLQSFQDIVHVLGYLEFVMKYLPDNAMFIDQVSHSGCSHAQSAGYVVEPGDLFVVVGEKVEGEREAGAELLMAVRTVGADADEVRPVHLDGFVCVTEALRLAVSAGGEVFRVEVEDCGSAISPFGESELPAVGKESLEIRGLIARFQHFPVDL